MAAAALCWSLGGLLIKSVPWPPLAVAGGRGFIAAAFLAAFAPRFRFTWSAAQIGGAVAYAATTVLFVTANKLTTAANAILLQYTAPVWIALFGAWFLGERATRADWLTIALVFGGMGLFFCDDLRFAGIAGNLVALASGVAFAAMTLLLRKQKDTSAEESIFLGNLLAGVIGLPFMFRADSLPDARGWGALALLGMVQLGLLVSALCPGHPPRDGARGGAHSRDRADPQSRLGAAGPGRAARAGFAGGRGDCAGGGDAAHAAQSPRRPGGGTPPAAV